MLSLAAYGIQYTRQVNFENECNKFSEFSLKKNTRSVKIMTIYNTICLHINQTTPILFEYKYKNQLKLFIKMS